MASTRKQREQDLVVARQGLTLLALCGGILVWGWSQSIPGAVGVFFIVLALIESLLLVPDLVRRRRLRACGYDEVYRMNGERFEEYLQALFQAKGYRATLTPNGTDFGADLVLEKGGKRLENEILACRAIASLERAPAVKQVEAALAPTFPRCPRCGEPMARRRSRHGEFWGCSTFPRCRGTRPA